MRNILIIRNDHIGDLALSTAVFREIKRKFPNSRITLIVSKIAKSLIEKNKNIDEIIELEMPNFKTIKNYLKIAKSLRKRNFDFGIDLRGSVANSLFLWIAGIKNRFGVTGTNRLLGVSMLQKIFLTDSIKAEFFTPGKHVIKQNQDIVNKALKMNLKNNWPEIITDEQDEIEVNSFIQKNRLKNFICICPFSGIEFKQWSIENFKELLGWLKQYNLEILLLGTKKEKEELEKLALLNKKCKIAINFNLRQMAVLFKKSKLVLAHDGGPMHIAWIGGANLIEIVPRNPLIVAIGNFAPLSKNSKIIWANGKDMSTIKVEKVEEEITRILDKEK